MCSITKSCSPLFLWQKMYHIMRFVPNLNRESECKSPEPDQELDGLAAGQLHGACRDLPGLGEEQERVCVGVDHLLGTVVVLRGLIVAASGTVLHGMRW